MVIVVVEAVVFVLLWILCLADCGFVDKCTSTEKQQKRGKKRRTKVSQFSILNLMQLEFT